MRRVRTQGRMSDARFDELRGLLEERRREIIGELHHKMRDVRDENAAAPDQGVRDEAEISEAEIQDDIEFAVLQMKAETLQKVADALQRLERGTFGYCEECGTEIAEGRLRALPFAARCTACEQAREMAIERRHHQDTRRGAVSLFPDMAA